MSDHLGEWRCDYCHYIAHSAFGWKKHLDNFHDGVEIRRIKHVDPVHPEDDESRVCFICRADPDRPLTIVPTLTALIEHIEGVHYEAIRAANLLACSERIYAGFDHWLAFEDYYRGREAA